MTTASNKAKGRRLQQYVAKRIVEKFTNLKPDDVVSRPMGSGGEDVMLSPFARDFLGSISFECKNKETWKGLYDAYDQAVYNKEKTKSENAVVVVKKNNAQPLVVIDFEFFLDLLI